MIILKNSELRVSVLDPIADRARLGPRYCTGGYVYQVEDHAHGALLSGPEYPSHAPSVINGQGLPEVFQHTLYDDAEERADRKLIIGVGLLDNSVGQRATDLHFSLPVESFCDWTVIEAPESITMSTHQSHKRRALALSRTVALKGRTLSVATRLTNHGREPMTFRWFAHPFFPRMKSDESYHPGFVCVLPENPGFVRNADGGIGLSASLDWTQGCYQLLMAAEGERFSVTRRHPLMNDIRAAGDYPMLKCAVWANQNTFSIEPFYEQTLDHNGEARWSMTYHF